MPGKGIRGKAAASCRRSAGLRARTDGACTPSRPVNYSSDAGAGSNTIMVMGDSPAWRAALLGTVAAGALWLGAPRYARAGPDPCDISVAGEATCTGDQSDGITSGGPVPPNFDPVTVGTLRVNNLDRDIMPGAGVDGIYFVRTGVDAGIVINSNTGIFDIDTRTANSRGIYTRAIGSITIDHTGDIYAGSGGIYASSPINSGGALSITTRGRITSYGQGIRAVNGGSGALEITTYGAVAATVLGSIGIYAGNSGNSDEGITIETHQAVTGVSSGIFARNVGDGALSITANGDVDGNNTAGIYAGNLGSGTDVKIEAQSVTGGTVGIVALNFGSGVVDITTRGDVTGNAGDGIYARHLGGPIQITVAAASSVTSNGANPGDFAIQIVNGATDLTVAGALNGVAGGGAVQFEPVAALNDRMTLHATADVNGNVLAGPGTDSLVFGGPGDGNFDVSRIGAGQQFQDFELFAKEGASHWTLTGTNTVIDNFAVEDGLLTVDGDMRNAAFAVTGGALGGTGIVGPTTVGNGGILAPGDSIGTFRVNGAFTLQAGAIFEVEVNALGQADKVIVTGTVNLSGAVLRVLAENGNYKPKTEYVIIENDGNDAVQGQFRRVTTNLAFLTPSVVYNGGTGNDVVLTLIRNDSDFCTVARTRNQCAVARALDQFPADNPLYLAVLLQTESGARQAFDALSGEIHATLPGVLLDDSRYVREAVLGRLTQAAHTNADGLVAALGTGGPQVAAFNAGIDAQAMALGTDGKHLAPPPPQTHGAAFWTRAYSAWGDFDGDGNAAAADRDLGGFLSGIDAGIGNGWRVGLAAGGAWSNVSADARRSHAEVESFNLAGYVGGMAGPLALRGGGAWTWSDIDTNRAVVFPGFFERQSSGYDADTGQIFGEVAYPMASGQLAFEPFAGLAYVDIDTDRFRERGGALSSLTGSSDEDVGYSTLGLRAATVAHVANMTVVPKISAAWQHAFDDVTPGASLAFASTGIGFDIFGVPLAEDSILLEAGLDFALSPTATLGVSYTGQFADDVSDNGVKGRLTWLF